MSQSPLGSYEAFKEQRGFLDKSAQLPEENSSNLTRVPKFSHVLRNLSSALGTGVAFYKYERLRYSPLRTLHRVLLKHVSDRAKAQAAQEEVYYVSSSEDNKDQTLLNPVSIKSINVTDQTYEECQSLITDFHDTPVAGHKGVKATYNALRKHYTWKGMKEQIQTYVKHCQKCQQSKVSNQKTSGSLVPLPTPSGPWLDVTMDFTEMPESLGYNYILVVVDRFSKEVVFVPCTKEEAALSTAELFRDHVWCQHGLPSSVVSDRGSVFASNFLGELYRLLGVKRKMSTAFHPQTNGQTERLNREINQYLRTYVNDRQSEWAKWIKIAQFVWNNTVSEVTTDSPFGITRSYSPRMGVEPVETVAPAAKDFAAIFNKVIESSEKAKCSMKLQADKHRNPAPDYVVGQQVWLSMDNLRMLNRASKKLTEKWIGPYEVTRVTPNAVELTKQICNVHLGSLFIDKRVIKARHPHLPARLVLREILRLRKIR